MLLHKKTILCSLADYIVFRALVAEALVLCSNEENLFLLRLSLNGQITKCWVCLR